MVDLTGIDLLRGERLWFVSRFVVCRNYVPVFFNDCWTLCLTNMSTLKNYLNKKVGLSYTLCPPNPKKYARYNYFRKPHPPLPPPPSFYLAKGKNGFA